MIRLLLLALLALLLANQPALAAEKQPISLAPVGKWEVNYDKDSCHLFRKFGTGADEVLFNLTRYQPQDWFDISLYGKPTDAPWQVRFDIELGFGESAPQKWHALSGSIGKNKPMVMLAGLRLDGWRSSDNKSDAVAPAINQAQENSIKAISFKLPGKKRYRLETGPMGAPMAAMRTCTTDLVRHWGFDPEVQAHLSRAASPLNDPARWLVTNDYPIKSAESGHNGVVQFRLDVDETGSVAACSVLHRTNPDDFADRTCQLLTTRARFNPALDAQGKPVRSFFISRVHWMVNP